jgi:hypothetical protein
MSPPHVLITDYAWPSLNGSVLSLSRWAQRYWSPNARMGNWDAEAGPLPLADTKTLRSRSGCLTNVPKSPVQNHQR